MPLRQIDFPSLGRRLSALMVAPSSAEADTHQVGLDAYHRLGGNSIHLHGEGGENHSRETTGDWLRQQGLRASFFLCAQICHEEWDEAIQQPINRFTPKAVHEDIAANLSLIGTDYLDLVYLDDRPGLPFEPVIAALGEEITSGRVRALGVRNWRAERVRAAHTYLKQLSGQGIAALITTELSLLASTQPLWPEYLPFDATLEEVVSELGLTVLAHAGDANLGQCLFGDEDASARLRPEWVQRWQHPANPERVAHICDIASARGVRPREVQIGWLLNQAFPVIAIVSLPSLLTNTAFYERGAQLRLEEAEWIRLNV